MGTERETSRQVVFKYMQLNEEQTRVVQHPVGTPICLVAGAGSGKTRVMTERVRWLMANGVEPRRICTLTFTNRAAGELSERLGITPNTPRECVPRVTTIHALALAAIRRNPKGFGLQDRVSLLDDYDQGILMRKVIDREIHKEAEREQFNPWNILEKIAYHRARGVGFAVDYTPEIHEAAVHTHSGYHALDSDLVQLWKKYEKEKVNTSTLDFDDMIHLVVRRVESDTGWAKALGNMFQHVLMDEAQDTNPIQWKLVNSLLSPDNFNFCAVGDISQSIYGFNGSAPEILKAYSEGWRGIVPTLYRLERNYRSVPEIVNLANAVQKKMTMTIPLSMIPARAELGHTGKTAILKAEDTYQEPNTPKKIAGLIADQIYADRNTIPFKENAILVRSGKTQVRDLETELVRLRIPYVVRGGQGLLQTEEVRDILSYLKLAVNPKDFMALNRAIAVPKRGMGNVALEKVRKVANDQFQGNLIEACWASSADKAGGFVNLMRHIQESLDDPNDALDKVIKLSGYRGHLQNKYGKKDKEKLTIKLENLERLAAMVAGLLIDNVMTLDDVVFQLSMDDQVKDGDPSGKVVISTIHKAKGLEWTRVYVTNCYQGSLPHMYSMGSLEEIDEERRLFYVAFTRAKDTAVICVPDKLLKRDGAGWKVVPVQPSQFLTELGIK